MADIRPKQQKAITALMNGATYEQAALLADITERTLYRWLNDAAFKTAYRQACDTAMSSAVIALSGALVEAVQVLRAVMHDEKAKSQTRVAAARAILDNALKMVELHELEQRVAALESERYSPNGKVHHASQTN